nr:MAG TPA: hypothetical protein [Caudoviricetes sp.]
MKNVQKHDRESRDRHAEALPYAGDIEKQPAQSDYSRALLQTLLSRCKEEIDAADSIILHGGALAIHTAYKYAYYNDTYWLLDGAVREIDSHLTVDTAEPYEPVVSVNNDGTPTDGETGETLADEPCLYVGGILLSTGDIRRLLAYDYILDTLYDAYCGTSTYVTDITDSIEKVLD